MKKIGFVDYYLSEWHANNYPAWIAEATKKLGVDYRVAYAWAEENISPADGVSSDEWCNNFGVEKCESIAELCEKSDVIMILAPSDPQKHLEYAKEVFKYGKRCYVDKTFAHDYDTALEIFKLGEETGTEFFSSSALRYGDELKDFCAGEFIEVCGGGSNIEEYIIHQAEMVIKLFKSEPLDAIGEKYGNGYRIAVKFANGKKATMTYAPELGFSVKAVFADKSDVFTEVKTNTFENLIADILGFFETGIKSFDVAETLLVMKLRDAVLASIK